MLEIAPEAAADILEWHYIVTGEAVENVDDLRVGPDPCYRYQAFEPDGLCDNCGQTPHFH